MTKVRSGANGTEIWDSLRKEWRLIHKGEASKLLSNALFPWHKTRWAKVGPYGKGLRKRG